MVVESGLPLLSSKGVLEDSLVAIIPSVLSQVRFVGKLHSSDGSSVPGLITKVGVLIASIEFVQVMQDSHDTRMVHHSDFPSIDSSTEFLCKTFSQE